MVLEEILSSIEEILYSIEEILSSIEEILSSIDEIVSSIEEVLSAVHVSRHLFQLRNSNLIYNNIPWLSPYTKEG